MNKNYEEKKNNSTYKRTQNILHGDTLYYIKRKKYKTVCAELAFVKVTFDRIMFFFYIEFVIFIRPSYVIGYGGRASTQDSAQ